MTKTLHPVSDRKPPERTLPLWRRVRWFIETIWALFGGPESIAELRNLSRGDHTLLASWLRKGEAFVRNLLVIEAASVTVEERKYKTRKAASPTKTLRHFYADEPQTWRVGFRLAPSGLGKSVARFPGAMSDPLSNCPNAWPLAERFEALLRVFDAPDAYVKRAARLLRRKPKTIERLTAPISFDGFEDIFECLRPPLLEARWAFKSSDTS